MKISVAHSTVYRYDRPVELGLHVIRLRPRDDGAQKLLCHDLRITPQPAMAAQATDQDGNVVTNAWFDESAATLEIHSHFTVETSRENPFDFLLTEESLKRIPAEYPEPVRPDTGQRGEGAGVDPGPEVVGVEIADGVGRVAKGPHPVRGLAAAAGRTP